MAKFIVEVTSNHAGKIELAKLFVDKTAEIGADYIKFQTWKASKLGEKDPQKKWFESSELTEEQHREIFEYCKKKNVEFLTAIFHEGLAKFLAEDLGMRTIKIPSPALSNKKVMEEAMQYFDSLIVSVGLHNEHDILETKKQLDNSNKKYIFLHTTSLYPTPPEKAHLGKMLELKRLGASVGYSDHTVGIEIPKIALVLGAEMVEKHLSLFKNSTGENFIYSDKLGRSARWDTSFEEMKELIDFSKRYEKIIGSRDLNMVEGEGNSRDFYLKRFG